MDHAAECRAAARRAYHRMLLRASLAAVGAAVAHAAPAAQRDAGARARHAASGA